MNFKHLFSGVLAMVVAISTVVAFSGQLAASGGAYWDEDEEKCLPTPAAGCTETNTGTACEVNINGVPHQIYKDMPEEEDQCTIPLFRVVNL